MWVYEKRLQYPVKIKNPNPKMAQFIMSQYGGPDGEIGASMRYLSQRYSMPYDQCKAVLTDIGTEELAHMEIVAAIIHQLTRNLTPEQIEESGFGPYYIDHTTGIWPQAAGGIPFNACDFQSKGDVITAEGQEHLRQHPAGGEGPGRVRSHPLPAGAGDRPLPAFR